MAQAGCGRPCAAVMHRPCHMREQPVMRHTFHIEDVRIFCLCFLLTPAKCHHRPHAGQFHRLPDDFRQFTHVARHHRPKADVHRLVARAQELRQRRVRRVVHRALIPPETGHVDVVRPILRARHKRRAHGVNHGHLLALHVIIRSQADAALRHVVLLAPIREVAVLQRRNQQIPDAIAQHIPPLAELAERRG